MWFFVTTNFYRVGSSAPRPTPNLEDQGISLSLASPSKPVTGAHKPPHPATKCLWQGGDTIEGGTRLYSSYILVARTTSDTQSITLVCSLSDVMNRDGLYQTKLSFSRSRKQNTVRVWNGWKTVSALLLVLRWCNVITQLPPYYTNSLSNNTGTKSVWLTLTTWGFLISSRNQRLFSIFFIYCNIHSLFFPLFLISSYCFFFSFSRLLSF
jgi:hypothetical protein